MSLKEDQPLSHIPGCTGLGCWIDDYRVEFHQGGASGIYVRPPSSGLFYFYGISALLGGEKVIGTASGPNPSANIPWRGRVPFLHPPGCSRSRCWTDINGISFHPGTSCGVYVHLEEGSEVKFYHWSSRDRKLVGVPPTETPQSPKLPAQTQAPAQFFFIRVRASGSWEYWKEPGHGTTPQRSRAHRYSLQEILENCGSPGDNELLLEPWNGSSFDPLATPPQPSAQPQAQFIIWDSSEELWALSSDGVDFTASRRRALRFSQEEAFKLVRGYGNRFLYPAPEGD